MMLIGYKPDPETGRYTRDQINAMGLDIAGGELPPALKREMVHAVIQSFAHYIGTAWNKSCKKWLPNSEYYDYEQATILYLLKRIPNYDPSRGWDLTPWTIFLINISAKNYKHKYMKQLTNEIHGGGMGINFHNESVEDIVLNEIFDSEYKGYFITTIQAACKKSRATKNRTGAPLQAANLELAINGFDKHSRMNILRTNQSRESNLTRRGIQTARRVGLLSPSQYADMDTAQTTS